MKVHKGVYYFATYQEARQYALGNNYPHDMIIWYERGWAIQLRVSGPTLVNNFKIALAM